jgi:hypothetical protein
VSEASLTVATDPLGAIRVELVGAARRRSAGLRRRRRIVAATAATALMSVASMVGAKAAFAGPICLSLPKPHGEGVGEAREGKGWVAPEALTRSLANNNCAIKARMEDGRTVEVRP